MDTLLEDTLPDNSCLCCVCRMSYPTMKCVPATLMATNGNSIEGNICNLCYFRYNPSKVTEIDNLINILVAHEGALWEYHNGSQYGNTGFALGQPLIHPPSRPLIHTLDPPPSPV